MNELTVTGKQSFMGREIPVVVGGFGPRERCICDKTAAGLHGMKTVHVRELIARNLKRFDDGVDILDMKIAARQTSNNKVIVPNDNNDAGDLLAQMGYTRMEIGKAEHIYILSRRGYLKLVKILETDEAWSIYNQLLDNYFALEDHVQNGTPLPSNAQVLLEQKAAADRAEAQKRNAADRNVKLLMQLYERAGIDPKYQLAAASRMFSDAGIAAPLIGVEAEATTYDLTEMARALRVFSKSRKPHSRAIGAILAFVGVTEDERVKAPYAKQHAGEYWRYKETVLGRVREWLEASGYPERFTGVDGQNYTVFYGEVSRKVV